MTPEQRLDRMERILGMFVNAGRKSRSEWRVRSHEQNEKINILIHTQMETSEQINRTTEQVNRTSEQVNRIAADVAANHAIHNKEMADLRKSQQLTDKALRSFINSLRKTRNGNSSD